MGEADSARAAYKRVVVLDPDRELDGVHFPPTEVALFSAVRAQVLQVPRGAIRVRSASATATVFVDGRRRGEGSIEVDGLVSGNHHVLVTSDTGHRSYASVVLGAGQRQDVNADLSRRFVGRPGADATARSMQTEALYRGLGDAVTDGLVLMSGDVGHGQVAVQVLEPRTGNVSRPLVGSGGSDPETAVLALAGKIGAFITETGVLRADDVAGTALPLDIETNPVLARVLLDSSPQSAPPKEKRTARKKTPLPWYVWAGIGVMAVGATGVALALQPKKATGGGGGGDDDGNGDGGTRESETGTVLVPTPG
jgi:hypothetical protein